MSSNIYSRFGEAVAAAAAGIPADTLRMAKHAHAVMESQEAVPFNREICKIAAAAYEASGESNAPAAILFRNLAAAETWYPQFNQFSDSVKRAMAKQAMLPLVSSTSENVGSPLRSLMALGALGGAGVGSLAFLLSRNASQSSAENADLLERVRAYKQLKKEIEEDMHEHDTLGKATGSSGRYDI